MIVGIDEVGRGAWAGPLAVGAVLLGGAAIDGLTDSKKLTKSQRTVLDLEIRQKARGVGIGWVSAKYIDKHGLSAGLKLAAVRALAHIRHEYTEIIIDGTIRLIDHPKVTLMKKADLLVPSVSAASIVAKVARDNYMRHADKVFPGYKFSRHVGYGTLAHRTAIRERGISPIHRLSYAPLHGYDDSPLGLGAIGPLTTKQIGNAAEDAVADHLTDQGHVIVARNWRTKFCEIDIVSTKGSTVFFTEVKHRRSDKQGGGLAAVTPKKHRQMTFAAELFAVRNGQFKNFDFRLAAADTTGSPPRIRQFLELL